MKRRLIISALAILFVAMQISMLGTVMTADAYPPITGGSIECDTTLQMIPLTHTIGGGTIHWTMTGDAASELRMLILDRLDNATIEYGGRPLLPNDTAGGRRIGEIDEAEMWAFVASPTSFLQHYLEGGGKRWVNTSTGVFEALPGGWNYDMIDFHGVQLTSSALTNGQIQADTRGLLGQTSASNADVEIYMTIRMSDTVKIEEVDLSSTTVMAAPFECLTLWNEHNEVIDPVEFRGDGIMKHYTINIGFDSFYDPSMKSNSLSIIRTPAGEIYYYSADVQEGRTIDETLTHSDFYVLENPQILFIFMMIFGYLMVALPTQSYLKYRSRYPKRYRIEAKKIKWLHWVARIFLLIFIILYFWPVIAGFYFSGPIFMALGVMFAALSAILGKLVYEKAAKEIPPEYFEERSRKKKKAKKTAAVASAVPTTSYESDREKIHCIRCGALITIKDGENLLKVKCPVCGTVQKRVERGYNHLILDSSLKNTYNMLADFLRDGDTALCISTTMPSKLKRTYHLSGKIKCLWLTAAGGKDTLDPGNLQKLTDTVEKFAQKYPASIVLLDGLEYLTVEHGFDEVMKAIKKITDVASMMDMTLIVPVNPSSLTSDELTILRGDFDRVEALEDIDEREFF